MIATSYSIGFEYFTPLEVAALWALLAVPVLLLNALARAGMPPWRRWTSVGLRLDVLLLLALALAGARCERRANDLEVMVLRDVSRSTAHVRDHPGPALQPALDEYVLAASEAGKPPTDRVGHISFDGHARIDALPAERLSFSTRLVPVPTEGTDVAAAIRLAMAGMRGDVMRRLVLIWDGNATAGGLDAALNEAAAHRIPIDVVPLRYAIDAEVSIERFVAPALKREDEPFSLEVVLRSTNTVAVTGRLSVTQRGRPLDMDPAAEGVQAARAITLQPGLNVERVRVPPQSAAGVHLFRAAFQPDTVNERHAGGPAPAPSTPGDTMLGNNTAEAFTFVRGRQRVLLIDNVPAGAGRFLADTLERQEARVDLRTPNDFPIAAVELLDYDAVVLANVPRGAGGLSEARQKLLADYVHDFGGGLVVIGGPDAFGAGGWIGSDLERVLPVDCGIPGMRVMPAGALVLVLDRSGSMSERVQGTVATKQALAAEAAVLALGTLTPIDHIGVIAFDSLATTVVPLAPNRAPAQAARTLREIDPGGGTDIRAGLEAAVAALESLPPDRVAVRHIILLTDGRDVPGDYGPLLARMERGQISLSTVGVGDDADDAVLAALASGGEGRYHRVLDPRVLPQIFIKEARTLRRALIRENRFTPTAASFSPLLAGIDAGSIPPLHGMVLTTRKPEARVLVPLVNDEGDPVLAHWQAGLGQVAAFTSGADARWTPAWMESPLYSRFWSQVLRGVSRPAVSGDFDVTVFRDGDGRGRILVEPLGRTADSGIEMTAAVAGPDGGAPRVVPMKRIAPGTFAGEFDATHPGPYAAGIRYASRSEGTTPGVAGYLFGGLAEGPTAEMRDLRSNEAMIRQVADRTGGRVLTPFDPASAEWFSRHRLTPVNSPRPIWDLLLAAAAFTFLLDVAIRRIALDRESIHWLAMSAAAFVRSYTQPGSGAAAGQSLAALRRAKEGLARQATEAPPVQATPVPPAGEVRLRSAAPPPGRLTAAPPGPPREDDGGSMASLLDAKRRARSRIEKTGQDGE